MKKNERLGMLTILSLLVMALGIAALGGEDPRGPIEIGDVNWGRDFQGALVASAASGKPVLVLFQEVPG